MDAETKVVLNKLTNQVERLQSTVRTLVMERKKKTYVNAEWIMRATGWTKKELRAARDGKLIEFKGAASRRYEYVLESIPVQFLKSMKTA